MNNSFKELVSFIRNIYGKEYVPLHRPVFEGNERQYLIDCVDSNFVSTVGSQVEEFEKQIAKFVGSNYAVAVVNGTAALQIALQLAGVRQNEEVITQSVSFIAICNAISYIGSNPVFIDVDSDTMGMSPNSLNSFLRENSLLRNGQAYNKTTGKRFAACCPMHTFGTPCRVREIVEVCEQFGIPVVEDAAESLGSYLSDRHVGTFGKLAAISFNGNKVITTGGGGMIITNDEKLAFQAKHLTTTAKVAHPYQFIHDEIGYNFRLPNLNACLGIAQMEKLQKILRIKTEIQTLYADFFSNKKWEFFSAPEGSISNYWLNAVLMDSSDERDAFLEYSNAHGVMTRPLWGLLSGQAMFRNCQCDDLIHSRLLEERLVNLPSSVPNDQFSRLA